MKIRFEGVKDEEMQTKINQMHEKALKILQDNGLSFPEEVTKEVGYAGNRVKITGKTPEFLRVNLNNRMRSTAGRAFGGYRIDINYRLFKEQPDHELEDTYVHELAHIYCHLTFEHNVAHGHEWRNAMRMMGQEPSRCHSLDVSHLKAKRTVRKVRFKCGCCERDLTMRYYNRYVRYSKDDGESPFTCNKCGEDLHPVV